MRFSQGSQKEPLNQVLKTLSQAQGEEKTPQDSLNSFTPKKPEHTNSMCP